MIELVPLFVVAFIALAAMALGLIAHGRHTAQTSALLGAMAAERYAWARERHGLLTRIQAPEVARTASAAIASPADASEALLALGVLQAPVEDESDEDVDESFLVGTAPGEA